MPGHALYPDSYDVLRGYDLYNNMDNEWQILLYIY